jgi:hypothetical protein
MGGVASATAPILALNQADEPMRASSAYLLMQGGEGSSPGALTCAKLRRFVQGDASELTILFAQSATSCD